MWRVSIAALAGALLWISVTALVIRALSHLGVWSSTHAVPGLVVGFLASALGFMLTASMIDRMLPYGQWAVTMYMLVLATLLPMLVSLMVPAVRDNHLWTVLGVVGSCLFAYAMIRFRSGPRDPLQP